MKNISSRSWSSGCILLFGCASDCRCAAFGVIFVISSTLVEAEEARGNADPLADKFIARQLVAEGDSVKGETLLEKRARLYRFISFAGVSVEQGQSSRVVDRSRNERRFAWYEHPHQLVSVVRVDLIHWN